MRSARRRKLRDSDRSPLSGAEPTTWRLLYCRAVVYKELAGQIARLLDRMETSVYFREAMVGFEAITYDNAHAYDTDDAAITETAIGWGLKLEEIAERASISDQDKVLITRMSAALMELNSHDPFAALFDQILVKVHAVYHRVEWPSPRLSILKYLKHPRRTPDLYGIGGLTKVGEDPKVEIGIYPDGFGLPGYAALAYVIAHELVCHAPAQQTNVDNYSVFSEGFMDWVAYAFLRTWVPDFYDIACATTLRYADDLYKILESEPTERWSERRLGHIAAENLKYWLYKNSTDSDLALAEMTVARLAVELNQLAIPTEYKDILVAELSDSDFAESTTDRLRRWAAGELSAGELVDAVIAERRGLHAA